MNVGFIGVGNMGSHIVNLMIDGGHHLTLWARRAASLEPFAGRADFALSAREVARASDLVGICVWDEDDVGEVLLGEDGVLSGTRPDAVIAVHSTISPAGCRRFHEAAESFGAQLVDAPVSMGANLPKLLMMLGGERSAVDRCRPALESVSDPLLYLGPIGSGQVGKLVHNTMLAATIGLGEDAVALGVELGLDSTALVALLAAGSARGTWCGFVERPWPGVASRTALGWAAKDVGFVESLAVVAGLRVDRNVLRLGRRGVEVLDQLRAEAEVAQRPD
jgi:3-hydroxyisobutyrate dehydrogenase-like beta-hydroxyacid dehydrogenase